MKSEKESKATRGRLWMALVYVTAAFVAYVWWVFFQTGDLLLDSMGLTLAGTITVFAFSFFLDNSSCYDPYWSLAPIGLCLFWLGSTKGAIDPLHWAVFSLILLWGLRLTGNFFRSWPGLHHEDWRYRAFRESAGAGYWAVSLTGIHLFPTALVLAGLLGPLHLYMETGTPLNAVHWTGMGLTLLAIVIETVADEQLIAYLRRGPAPGAILDEGLWRFSRHPNYFGELAFWWGVWVISLGNASSPWWTCIGPIAMTALFGFVSVPLLDKRSLARRPQYQDHMDKVSPLVPWFRKTPSTNANCP